MGIYSIPIVTDWQAEVPPYGGEVSKSYNLQLEWGGGTSITRAEAYFKAIHTHLVGIIKADAWLWVNGYQVAHFAWVGAGGPREASQDISSYIRRGGNSIVWKVQDISGVVFFVTARIDIYYTGEPPQSTVGEVADIWWWWPLALIGGAAAVVTVAGIVIWQEKQRSEQLFLLAARR